MKLKIKECYVGATITIKTEFGKITFDTISAEEKDYEGYYGCGFSHMFEEIKPKSIKYSHSESVIHYKGIGEIPTKIINKDGETD